MKFVEAAGSYFVTPSWKAKAIIKSIEPKPASKDGCQCEDCLGLENPNL